MSEPEIKVLLIASSRRGEGKTLVLNAVKEALEKQGFTCSDVDALGDAEYLEITKEKA